jgi:hypothetical protein
VGGEEETKSGCKVDDETRRANLSAALGEIPAEIRQAILTTLPDGPGQRHRRIFNLVRRLKAHAPELGESDLLGIVRVWHGLALAAIRTKALAESLADAVSAWEHVRAPQGNDRRAIRALDRLVSQFDSGLLPMPGCAAGRDPATQRFLAILAAMQEDSDPEPFGLTDRAAGELLGVSHPTARKRLLGLVEAGVLQEAQTGSREYDTGGRVKKATWTQWRFVGDV